MSNPLDACNSISELRSFVLKLEPSVGAWGGRFFIADGICYRLNDVVHKLFLLSQTLTECSEYTGCRVKKMIGRIKALDKRGEEALSKERPFIQVLTWIRHIVGRLFFSRADLFSQIEMKHYAHPLLPIEKRLEKNIRFAKEHQERQLRKGSFYIRYNPNTYFKRNRRSFKLESFSQELNGFRVGGCSCTGLRRTNEDTYIATEISEIGTLFGVFDGHGGPEASLFVRENITRVLTEKLASEEGIWHALRETCIQLDRDFNDDSGTTALFGIVIDGSIWVANLGDSRGLLVRRNEVIQLTEDQKSGAPRYMKRIEYLGGVIIDCGGVDRVDGNLALARAIGDRDFKSVSAVPKITKYELESGDRLVFACDGLFDVATTDEVGNSLQDDESPEQNARNLVYSAIYADSQDNVTVLVIDTP